jgi:putative FmdB family regulatory protein
MPLYEFDCESCGGFSVLKRIVARNDGQPCPACGRTAQRNVISAPALACMPSAARHAAQVNERSRHEPRHSAQDHAHDMAVHGSGATHGNHSCTEGATKTFLGKRPWMISH